MSQVDDDRFHQRLGIEPNNRLVAVGMIAHVLNLIVAAVIVEVLTCVEWTDAILIEVGPTSPNGSLEDFASLRPLNFKASRIANSEYVSIAVREEVSLSEVIEREVGEISAS